jgi:hypothetical protein
LGAPNNIPSWVEQCVLKIPVANGEELLDVNIEAFASGLSREAIAALDRGEFSIAINMFTTLLSITPNAPTVFYNLACSHARAGSTDEALQALQQAISVGFSDFAHMQADPDLQSVRGCEVYQQMLLSQTDSSSSCESSSSSGSTSSSSSSQPSLKCPAGHDLVVTPNPRLPSGRPYFRSQYVCDGCSACLMAYNHPVSHCQRCEFDLCPSCAAVTVIAVSTPHHPSPSTSTPASPHEDACASSSTQTFDDQVSSSTQTPDDQVIIVPSPVEAPVADAVTDDLVDYSPQMETVIGEVVACEVVACVDGNSVDVDVTLDEPPVDDASNDLDVAVVSVECECPPPIVATPDVDVVAVMNEEPAVPSTVAEPEATVPATSDLVLEERHQVAIAQLVTMGFNLDDRLLAAVQQFDGNLPAVIDAMIGFE